MATRKKTTTKRTTTARTVKKTPIRRRTTVSSKPAKHSVGVMDYFHFGESYTSLILGIIVVILAAILLVAFLRGRTASELKSQQDTSSTNTTSDQQEQKTYTVKAGDNLWKIAEDQLHDGYQWVAIAKANNLANPGDIHAGNKLVIPQNANPVAQAGEPTSRPTPTQSQVQQQPAAQPAAPNKITGDSYTIQHGDDLWDIAVRAYGDGYKWVDIAKANNLMNTPNLIFSGNKLVIPRS